MAKAKPSQHLIESVYIALADMVSLAETIDSDEDEQRIRNARAVLKLLAPYC